ncbi:ABC transporter ATP-binding protein/permease [Candidatus Bipolaricaulota bacterium]|nr:ABC transporter ATP-binding protein/permease [Candidatus Bipolaricaulota bacterium]
MKSPIRRFLTRFILPRWKLGLALVTAMLGSMALTFPIPLLFRKIVDEFIPQGRFGELSLIGAALVTLVGIRGLLFYLRQYLTVVSEETLVQDVQNTLLRHIMLLPPAFFKDREVGYLMARIRSDPAVAKGFFLGTLSIITNAIFLVTGAGILFWLDWRLAFVAVAILPVLALASRRLNMRMQALCQGIQEGDALVSRELGEALSSVLTTKLLGLAKWVEGKVAKAIECLKWANISTNTVGAIASGVLTFIVEAGPVLLLWLGAYRIMQGGLSLGTVIAFTSLITYLYGPTQSLITTNLNLQRARVAARRIFELLDEQPELSGGSPLHIPSGEVRVNGVTFVYPNGTVALRGVSLAMAPGIKVALVGRTGSGKSTLLSLLVRLHDPTEGTIYIDGQEVREVDLASLRRQVVLVTQEVFLFSATVLDNLRGGDPNISDEEILKVTRALGAHEFIEGLSSGYDTVIGERGGKLSGGQRQLLALCRAVLRKPKILLLDEATSAMDSETEGKVWQSLNELLPNTTLIVAAHRLTTVKSADWIFVLKEGRLVEEGTHGDLIAQGGEYQCIFQEQLATATKGR